MDNGCSYAQIGAEVLRVTKMTILETIIRELSSAPEALLLQVFNLIQSTKEDDTLVSNLSNAPRTPGLHQGEIWMSDDFNDPLPDEFWLGED
ncbi:MAG: hypothetical protein AN484_10600 [Aphanizomenon flos-aquae WA102]|jgi:hypothetical protein|uniref:DUF2281 domain-containing protein n=1 Tax=Aphanizomenon flos-aquae WA102 TaxID=1710896 RepID=A0A1B7X300_APHFL|nr:MAG: hypothetical protein AN484_10600 [Aphanizomenon flos-aquae WA102]